MKALIHQEKTLFQLSLKNIKAIKGINSINFIRIKNKSKTFRFRETNADQIKKIIEKVDLKKAFKKSDMSKNILLKNAAFSSSTSAITSTL